MTIWGVESGRLKAMALVASVTIALGVVGCLHFISGATINAAIMRARPPGRRAMQPRMIGTIRKYQIAVAVVGRFLVVVMHDLVWRQVAPYAGLNNQAMLLDIAARIGTRMIWLLHKPIAFVGLVTTAIPMIIARTLHVMVVQEAQRNANNATVSSVGVARKQRRLSATARADLYKLLARWGRLGVHIGPPSGVPCLRLLEQRGGFAMPNHSIGRG